MRNQIPISVNNPHTLINRNKTTLCDHIDLRGKKGKSNHVSFQ
uniref:Dihydrolipoyl dehydrogenase n=1 Tax=Rhizophora mucronata TaxID=61149 RepID=A0A2P2L8C6_RHIMU